MQNFAKIAGGEEASEKRNTKNCLEVVIESISVFFFFLFFQFFLADQLVLLVQHFFHVIGATLSLLGHLTQSRIFVISNFQGSLDTLVQRTNFFFPQSRIILKINQSHGFKSPVFVGILLLESSFLLRSFCFLFQDFPLKQN